MRSHPVNGAVERVTHLRQTLRLLETVATVTPEFTEQVSDGVRQRACEWLLARYPGLARYPAYLELLRATGGAHIHNREFSLGIYGFRGVVVTSFEEGNFLDDDRYFHFGEVLYHVSGDPEYMFALDFREHRDVVFVSPMEDWEYVRCADSVDMLLVDFAKGARPGLPGSQT